MFMDFAIPRIMMNDSIKNHDTAIVGHVEVKKNLESIQRPSFWPKLQKDVESYVQSRVAYQQNNASIRNQLVYNKLSLFPNKNENISLWISYVSYQKFS